MQEKSQTLTKIVGSTIHKRRKSLEMSQEQLAEFVGIGQQSLSRMEQGIIAPKFERLQQFADALHCRVVDLFSPPEETEDSTALVYKNMLSNLNEKERGFVLKQTEELIRFLKEQKN